MKGRSLRSCLWEGNNVPKKIDILGVKVDPVTMDEPSPKWRRIWMR